MPPPPPAPYMMSYRDCRLYHQRPPNFILGDFNHVSLEKTLTNFYQYVSCPTRRGKTLDLCYGSIKNAFKSLPLPPLGSADLNCVYLLPTHKTVLKREKIQTREVKVWTNDAVSSLQGCFDCTDWGMSVCTQLSAEICSYPVRESEYIPITSQEQSC